MGQLRMGHLDVADAGEGGAIHTGKALGGAVGGAVAMGLVYGLVGRLVGEYSYVAFLIGAASGIGAMKLGGGRSMTVGALSAAISLAAVLAAKLIVGAPDGIGWLAYHTTTFDIVFCYLACPAAAFFAAGTDKSHAAAHALLESL